MPRGRLTRHKRFQLYFILLLGVGFMVLGAAILPALVDEIANDLKNDRIRNRGARTEARIDEKGAEPAVPSRLFVSYSYLHDGRAYSGRRVVLDEAYASATIGERLWIQFDPKNPAKSVSRFDREYSLVEKVLLYPTCFLAVLGVIAFGAYLIVNQLGTLRLLRRGRFTEFEVLEAVGSGFRLKFQVGNHEYVFRRELPTSNPAEVVLLVDPERPAKSLPALRSWFRQEPDWKKVAQRVRHFMVAWIKTPEIGMELRGSELARHISDFQRQEPEAWLRTLNQMLAADISAEILLTTWLEESAEITPDDRRALMALNTWRSFMNGQLQRGILLVSAVLTLITWGTVAVAVSARVIGSWWTMPAFFTLMYLVLYVLIVEPE